MHILNCCPEERTPENRIWHTGLIYKDEMGGKNMQSNISNFLFDIFKNCYFGFRKKYLRLTIAKLNLGVNLYNIVSILYNIVCEI